MIPSIIRGSIPPRTTYATPSRGGMSQLVHKIGSAALAKNEGSCDAFCVGNGGMVMGRMSYRKRHWL
jgi:hypothetical protein